MKSGQVVQSERTEQPKRYWPGQGDAEAEAIAPPRSTSIAETSNAHLLIDLFHGKLHLELLEYPELRLKNQVSDLNALHERVKHVILKVNSRAVDHENFLPPDSIATLSDAGLLGLHIDRGMGGQGLSHTEAARVWESAALDGAVLSLMDSHNSMATRAILTTGTSEQKLKFLSNLATGRYIATFCLHELSSGSDLQATTTNAVQSDEGTHYILNGQKSWVISGAVATHFIVFARLQSTQTDQSCTNSNLTAFIVHRDAPGIQVGSVLDTFGLRGSNVTDVVFDNVKVPCENRLGSIGDGLKIAEAVMDRERLDLSAACSGLVRYLISYVSEHCLQRHQFGRPIAEFPMVASRIADLTLKTYVMESGVHYLTGLLDAHPTRDLSLEMAALKIFSTEALWSSMNHCMELTGRTGLLKDVPFERYFRDARTLLNHCGSNDLLRLRIAGAGICSLGPGLEAEAEKLRFANRHLFAGLKRLWRIRCRRRGWYVKQVGAGAKVTEGGASPDLKNHLHPNLADSATKLAHLCQRFQSLSESLLLKHRGGVVDEQLALGRVADCAIYLLLIPICLGRASRSISIGVHLHDYEIRLANAFARFAFRELESTLLFPQELDRDRHRIASEVLARRHYPASHPLTRVW